MRLAPIVLALALVATLALLWFTGLLADLSDRERIAAHLTALGPYGPLLFIALVLALFPFFLIGPVVWSASAVWPPLPAVAYASLACSLASLLCYALARCLGREWAQQHVPASVRRYEDRLVNHPIRTLLMLRLLLWANPAVDLLVGVTRVSTRDYLLATLAGLVPVTAFHVLLVGKGFQQALTLPGWMWLLVAASGGAALTLRAVRKRRRLAAERAAR